MNSYFELGTKLQVIKVREGGFQGFCSKPKFYIKKHSATYDVTCCKTVSEEIFGTSDSWLKWLGIILTWHIISLKYHHRKNKMLQLWYADGSESEEDKEELIKVEAISINVSGSSGNEDDSRTALVIIYAKDWTELHPNDDV